MRIATASVRTGFAMTLVFHGGAVCGGAHGPRPTRLWGLNGGRTGASAPTVLRNEEERRGGALPLPRAGKSAKRRRWRMQRAGFEEVPRLADATVAGNRLARRWAREPRPYAFVGMFYEAGAGGQRRLPLRAHYWQCGGLWVSKSWGDFW